MIIVVMVIVGLSYFPMLTEFFNVTLILFFL